jgi:hypothetical protein
MRGGTTKSSLCEPVLKMINREHEALIQHLDRPRTVIRLFVGICNRRTCNQSKLDRNCEHDQRQRNKQSSDEHRTHHDEPRDHDEFGDHDFQACAFVARPHEHFRASNQYDDIESTFDSRNRADEFS